MLRLTKELHRSEEGQAIVLAAVGLLVMALALASTLQIGYAIHERIQLQNAADAQAYSVAAAEARAFNFVAFVNRAQVVHYVAMMSIEHLIGMLTAVHAALGMLQDMAQNAAALACMTCYLTGATCWMKPILDPLSAGLDQARDAAKSMLDGFDSTASVVETIWQANSQALSRAEKLMRDGTALALGMGAFGNALGPLLAGFASTIASVTDPTANLSPTGAALGLIQGWNTTAFQDAWADGPSDLPSTDPDGASASQQGAMRVMNEIANATRAGVSGMDQRSLTNARPGLGPFGDLAVGMDFGIHGQVKQIEIQRKEDFSTDSNEVWKLGLGASQLTRGAAMSSAWHVNVNPIPFPLPGLPSPMVVGIQAAPKENDRYHCHYDQPHSESTPLFGCKAMVTTKPVKCDQEERHNWGGIAGYQNFKPDPDPQNDFNQPNVWSILNKAPDAASYPADLPFGMGSGSSGDFTFTNGPATGTMSQMKVGQENTFLPGMNVISRALCYYHRPGHWAEPPNMFNPFWRPKLAPTGEKVEKLMAGLGDFLGGIATGTVKEILTH